MNWADILVQGIISILTFALGAVAAFSQQYYQKYRDFLKERYFGLYRPFIQMYAPSYMVDGGLYSDWEFESQMKLVDLLKEKDYLAPKTTQSLILNFAQTTIRMNYPNAEDNAEVAPLKDNAYEALYNAMKSDYLLLSKKLKYGVSPWLKPAK